MAADMHNAVIGHAEEFTNCIIPGWSPAEFGLKDHTIFWYDGAYYMVSTYVPAGNPSPISQDRFIYARSADLCSWEILAPLLAERIPGAWDETAVWAPYVLEENEIYYLFYTGVTQNWTQSIMLATTTNPADPSSWQKEAVVFQPSHADAVWEAGLPSDCRDPYVMKQEDRYYLYYTGQDRTGGVIGVATAASPQGPWIDWGGVVGPLPGKMPESPTIASYEYNYYLFYNLSRIGEFYQIGNSPAGPWLEPVPFIPGWAHEVWRTPNGKWMTSYLTNYSVTIAQIAWKDYNNIPRPTIEGFGTRTYLPLIRK